MKLLVIDGNSIMNRAFYGIRVLTNKKGMPTNALTGFLNIFLKLMKEEAPDRIAVAFDLHAPTFRHKMYADYKGTRHAMPDELRAQMPIIKQILTALGVAIVEKEGYEADDIIGTLSHAAESQGGECTISTGDRDSFQLITDKVTVRLASNKEDIIYTPAKIAEVYGVTPREMLEVKTLMGDSSDNIPGVPGVGEKTALGLIQKYHTVDYIYQNLDAIEVTKGVRAKLENGRGSAELSRKLAEITLEAPVELDMSAYEKKDGDPAEAAGILTEMEMFGVMKKLGLDKTAPAKVALASIASEGTAPAPDNAGTPAVEAAEKADIPEFDPAAYDVAFSGGEVRVFLAGKPQEGAAAILASEAPKRTDDAKALYSYCMKNGMELKNVVFDAALAGYLLNVNSSDYTVERLCAEYGVTYSAERLGESLFLLNRALWEKIHQQEMYGVLADIEIPLAEVLSSMEIEGVKLDTEALREFGDALQPKIREIEQDIYKEAGHEFNIGSPKQLSVVLFEELGLPAGKKRKTGYSTDADTLEGLRGRHPIIPLIFDYRTLTKLYNTYVKGLEAAVSPDGRMHTTFKQTETRTGRISSAEPNIQNIPVRTEIGRNFRRFFVAGEGRMLADADYSQIELRVLAHLSGDKAMIKTFCEGGDIHTETAASVLNVPPELITPEQRRSAKAVNFGIVYGIGAFSLAKDINVSVPEAKRYIDDYLTHYSGVKAYMDKVTASAEKDGWAVTMFGRKRFIPEILSTNKTVKALGKRIAMNTPIQGTAADIIKIAMIRVYRRLKKELPEAKLILQVHDELIVEAPEAQADKAAQILTEEMQGAVKLAVPLTADAKEGRSWYEAH
jgi:DNA-directed DNA polymerase